MEESSVRYDMESLEIALHCISLLKMKPSAMQWGLVPICNAEQGRFVHIAVFACALSLPNLHAYVCQALLLPL